MLLMAGLALADRAHADFRLGNGPAETVRLPSPFVRGEGEAVWFKAPADRHGGLEWHSDQVVPGQRHSISFFFMNRVAESPAESRRLVLTVFDGQEQVHTQVLYRRKYAQFYATELEFISSDVVVRLDLPAGEEVVVGEFGRAVDVGELAATRYPLMMELWMPGLQLPDVYRGLRKFLVDIELSDKRRSDLFGLRKVSVEASMKVATANLPRLLPGENRLVVASEPRAPGGRIEVEVQARSAPDLPALMIEHEAVVPADGATFGRAFIRANDASGQLVAGTFHRVSGPPGVNVRPYVKAVADSRKLQYTQEFHYSSPVPGRYALNVERWNGRNWEDTGERLEVDFEGVGSPAPEFRQGDYVRRWMEPQPLAPGTGGQTRWSFAVDAEGGSDIRELEIESELAPRIDWVVRGPVRGLGLFADFQADPRTIRSTAQSLWTAHAAGREDPELAFALAVEGHVALLMEGMLPEEFTQLEYPSLGRILREGRGWCHQYAEGVYALAVEGAVEARLRNLPRHVTNELRGAQLPLSNFDAMMQMAVTDDAGRRVELDRLNTAARVMGAGVDGATPRGAFAGYLHDPLPSSRPWMRQDSSSPVYRHQFFDDRVLTIDLEPWETLSWRGGSLDPLEIEPVSGLRAENQSVLTQRSRLTAIDLMNHPQATVQDLQLKGQGLLAPSPGYKVGRVRFPVSFPLEVSDLLVELEGSIDVGGQVVLGLRPDLPSPLLSGTDWW